jgi:hypothetical protein
MCAAEFVPFPLKIFNQPARMIILCDFRATSPSIYDLRKRGEREITINKRFKHGMAFAGMCLVATLNAAVLYV